MGSSELSMLQSLKISLLCRGISVSPAAKAKLTHGGAIPLSVYEYATTGGLTLLLKDNVYVNAPFDEPIAEAPEATLLLEEQEEVPFRVLFHGEEFPTQVLPLPGYLFAKDSRGRLVTEAVFSHADRARLSPIGGCHNRCGFCDSPLKSYELRPAEQLMEALAIAQADTVLPVHHAVISGGTPKQGDYSYFSQACETIIRNAAMPVDVMMAPREDTKLIDQLSSWGVYGFAINLELYDDEMARRIAPQKRGLGVQKFGETIERAVECTGGRGRVRSLLLVGLEPEEQTLKGVEFLARLGCDPVLSPFRPAPDTPLANHPGPSYELLESVYLRSLDIVERHGVKLGPRCIPCTHNTLTFADRSGAYYFSQELQWSI
jgi:hypothetical protein